MAAIRQAKRYLPHALANSTRLSVEFMPASAINIARPRFQPRTLARTLVTVVTSAVLPGSTQLRTGMPSRVTSKATNTCGAQLLNGFETLLQTEPSPKGVCDQRTAQGESLFDFHVGRQADGNCRVPSCSQRIIKPQTTNAANGLTETDQLLAVELVNPAEVVDDFGDGFAGIRMPLVMGELEVFDDRAVLIGALCDSSIHAY